MLAIRLEPSVENQMPNVTAQSSTGVLSFWGSGGRCPGYGPSILDFGTVPSFPEVGILGLLGSSNRRSRHFSGPQSNMEPPQVYIGKVEPGSVAQRRNTTSS